jgi:glutamate synthase (NADPH/NADH) small chain
LHNYIPHWLKSVAYNDLELAFNLSNDTNPFPEITGRVCPQDRLCEGDCTLNEGHGAVTIGSIETFITEQGVKHGLKPRFNGIKSDKRVAVIGSGPAAMSCATYLLRYGIGVDMYEKSDKPGGLLTYGIPNFKLEKEVVLRRYKWLEEAGLKLFLNTEIGKDMSLDELVDTHDGVFLAIGVQKSRIANIPHEDAKGVLQALDLLVNIQKKNFGQKISEKYDLRDKDVIVIGGGDTAMDCLRTSIREGARSVKCLYRRDQHNMPGSKKEFKNTVDEGVDFFYNLSPKEILVDGEDNKVVGIEMQKTILSEKDGEGRQRVEIVKGSEHRFGADIIIFALGFEPENPDFLAENGIETNKWGEIVVDDFGQTTKSGVFAGGDCIRGADLVVTAARDGRICAQKIVEFIEAS